MREFEHKITLFGNVPNYRLKDIGYLNTIFDLIHQYKCTKNRLGEMKEARSHQLFLGTKYSFK
jgi:hypothetical protein